MTKDRFTFGVGDFRKFCPDFKQQIDDMGNIPLTTMEKAIRGLLVFATIFAIVGIIYLLITYATAEDIIPGLVIGILIGLRAFSTN